MKKTIAMVMALLVLVCQLGIAKSDVVEAANSADDFYVVYVAGGVQIEEYLGTSKDVVIPDTFSGRAVVAINAQAFRDKGLTSVEIPSSVTAIGQQAFYNNKLTSVEIPSGVTTIGRYAFYGNRLISVEIPSNLTTIEMAAFGSNQLTSVEIPSGVTSIGQFAFGNNQLTSVEIPSSVTTIEQEAFADNKLTSVELPSSVTIIGASAFANNKLTSVVLPNGLISLGNSSFANNQLSMVQYHGDGITTVQSPFPSQTSTISGNTMGGWYNDENHTTAWNNVITAPITLYAKWAKNKVSFEAETEDVIADQIVNYDGKAVKPAVSKEGYKLVWYKEATFDTVWDFNTAVVKTNTTLYGDWRIRSDYTVTYESNGGTLVDSVSVEDGELLTKPASDPIKEGYTFGGWYTSEAYTNAWSFTSDRMPAQAMTLYAKWTTNSYTVT